MECGFCMRICEGTTPMAKWQSKLVAYGNWGIKDSYQDMPSETKRVGNGKKEKRERETGQGSNDARFLPHPLQSSRLERAGSIAREPAPMATTTQNLATLAPERDDTV